MKQNLDIRWEQRFSNFIKAFDKLTIAVAIIKPTINKSDDVDDIDELQREGLIRRFEYTQELAWKVLSDYAKYQGITDIKGSRDAFRYGLANGILDSEDWMNTIEDRNRTSHTYDDNTAYEILVDIVDKYYPLFKSFRERMEEFRS